MNAYETLVKQMRKAGSFYNAPAPQLGVMLADGKIKIDTMTLDKADYLIDCNLRLDNKEKVFLHTSKLGTESHDATLREYKRNILAEGDKVLILKLQKHEKYIVIAKVVSAL